MKKFLYTVALLLMASSAMAQGPTCDAQIRNANAMMKELMQHVHIMSDRAARHYAVAQALEVALAAANAEIARLSKEK